MNINYIIKQMETISILGCGWLGLPLAKDLKAMGYHVKGSSTSEYGVNQISSIGVQPFVFDIENQTNNIKQKQFLQSNTLVVNVPSKKIWCFEKLLLRIEKSEIKKLLFVSSTSVYPSNNQIITEETETIPQFSPLLTIEDLFRSSKVIDTTVIRFGGLIGYDRHPAKFFSLEKPVPSPDSNINMIHRDDCIRIIEQIIAQKAWGEVFNCCADSHPTKRDFYTKLANDIGAKPPAFMKTDKTEFKIISNAKVKKHLNFEFKYSNLMDLKI